MDLLAYRSPLGEDQERAIHRDVQQAEGFYYWLQADEDRYRPEANKKILIEQYRERYRVFRKAVISAIRDRSQENAASTVEQQYRKLTEYANAISKQWQSQARDFASQIEQERNRRRASALADYLQRVGNELDPDLSKIGPASPAYSPSPGTSERQVASNTLPQPNDEYRRMFRNLFGDQQNRRY